MKHGLLIFLLLAGLAELPAQTVLSGKIIDSRTQEPLPFVNLLDTVNNFGTSSDIDGHFELNSLGKTRYLKLSYVGYETQIYDVGKANKVTIKLVKKSYSLRAVEVFPGENPAHRIIHKVYDNRDLNNPEKNGSFTYETYNKFVVTADIDTTKPPRVLEIDSSRFADLDTSDIPDDFDASEFEDDQFLKNNDLDSLEYDTVTTEDLAKYIQHAHLFLMESVTFRKYRPPNRDKEVVLASRVSGFKSAQFAAIARQLQSFTFYDENFYLGDREYVNPISKNSTKKYLFILEDTIVNNPDTTFIISFRPRIRKKFDGLRGLLYINTQGYAVEKVLAEPSEYLEGANITMQQNYQFIDGRKWFPVQLKSEIYFMLDTTPDSDRLIGRLNGYIENIELDPVLKKREFNHIVVEMDPMASAQTPEFWESKRRGEFTYKDTNTYHIMDSIGKELNFERNLYILNALFSGKVPYKFINFDLNRLMRFNGYEIFRLGLGAHTNDRFSRYVSFGGYFGYGFGDKEWKYGGDISYKPYKYRDLVIKGSYINDVVETGATEYYVRPKLQIGSHMYRPLFINRMDRQERWQGLVSWRMVRFAQPYVFFNKDFRSINDGYRYYPNLSDGEFSPQQHFHFTEVGIGVRYALNEKYVRLNSTDVSLGTKAPVISAKYTRGIQGVLDGQFDYNRFDLKISGQLRWRVLGRTQFCATGGYIDTELPRTALFNAPATFGLIPMEVDRSFQTMRPNEFFSDRYSNLFFKHSFPKIRTKSKYIEPVFVIYTNLGIGDLSSANQQGSPGTKGV